VFAVVSFLIFVAVLNSTGRTGAPQATTSARDNLPYLVVAFVVGFREETFRTLLKRTVDVLLGPGIPGQTVDVVVTAHPREGSRQPGRPDPVEITVSNTGGTETTISRSSVTVNPPNAASAAWTTPVDGMTVGPLSHVTGQLVLNDSGVGPFNVQVEVLGSFGARSVTIRRG